MHNRHIPTNSQATGIFQVPDPDSGIHCFYVATPAHPCLVSAQKAQELYAHNCQIVYARNEQDAKAQIARALPWLNHKGQPILGLHNRTHYNTSPLTPKDDAPPSTPMRPTKLPQETPNQIREREQALAQGKYIKPPTEDTNTPASKPGKPKKRTEQSTRQGRAKAHQKGLLDKDKDKGQDQ